MKLASLPLSSIGTVTVIAALVWMVAEGQTLRDTRQSVQVVLHGGADEPGAKIVRVSPGHGWPGTVELHLEAATAKLDELADKLIGQIALTIGRQRELPTEPGEHEINLREALRAVDPFRSSGVVITSATPETLRIEVDVLERVDIPVAVGLEGVELDSPPSAEPENIAVSAPASVLAEWRAAGSPPATMTVGPERLRALTPGIAVPVANLPIFLPEVLRGRWATRADISQGVVTLRLRSRTGSFTAREIPVKLLLPPGAQGRWIVEVTESSRALRDVVLTGPESAIERIRSGAHTPLAVVDLSLEELEQGVGSKPARIVDLPAGVTYQVADQLVNLDVRLLSGVQPADGAGAVPAGP